MLAGKVIDFQFFSEAEIAAIDDLGKHMRRLHAAIGHLHDTFILQLATLNQEGKAMENQHRQITGYRDLSEVEIAVMNKIKSKGAELGELVGELKSIPGLDPRWISIGATDLQKGLMALTRAVAQPTSF